MLEAAGMGERRLESVTADVAIGDKLAPPMQLDLERTRTAPCGFERDPKRSHGDPRSASAIVVGENLDVMKRLVVAGFEGRFKCVYFDPPFNSGRRYDEYTDALDPTAWRAMIRDRLEVAARLLAEDGAIFVEIDDT